MKPRHSLKLLGLAVALLGSAFAATSASAQGVTTAAISGTVTNAAGTPLQGVQITATNTATGAVRGVLTREDGRYLLPGLPPGGPYRIQAEGLGYQPGVYEGVTLALSQTERFDFTLSQQAIALEGIEVTAERGATISKDHMGTSTVVSDSAISRLPTISRDFTDFTRLSPQISTGGAGASAAGRNNRFNSIQIDGAVNNDLFGLGASGTPGGQVDAKPITLDAIQEFQVVISPIDVRQGGFTGAGINAITKSGTNEFEGSFSYYNKNDALVGNYKTLGGDRSPDYGDFSQNEFAGSFGGPIIKDKLHFFVAAEVDRRNSPVGVIAGQSNANIAMDSVQAIANILQGYGYQPGTLGGMDLGRDFNNVFGRIDWNISPKHRLTIRDNYVGANEDDFSRSSRYYPLGSRLFVRDHVDNSLVAQLNSTFSNNLFNELRLGYMLVRDERKPQDRTPSVDIRVGQTTVQAGSEQFSGKNILDQDAFELTDDVTLVNGRHTFTLGTHNEYFKFSNLFVRNAYGYYQFGSIADLAAGTPSHYEYSYLLPGGAPRADFPVLQTSWYAQDEMSLTDNFTLTAGLRYDYTALPDSPERNADVDQYFGRNTSEVPSGGLINPRLGFNWDINGDQSSQLRAGIGWFSGRTPGVWVSNAYGNTGLDYVRFTCEAAQGVPAFESDPSAQATSCTGSTSLAPNEINTIDPNFKMPQVWRANVAFDHRLPLGFTGTLEGLYTGVVNDIRYQDLSVRPTTQMVEGRPRYETVDKPGSIGHVFDLTNTDKGYSYSVTGSVERKFMNNFFLNASYTYSQSKDVAYSGSSQAGSNFKYRPSISPNEPELSTSDFSVPHRIVVSGSYEVEWSKRAPTNISLIYVGESGRPFSYIYYGDVNGDGQNGNDLLYVPASASDIRFEPVRAPGTNGPNDKGQSISPEAAWSNLNDFINSSDCLSEARGSVLSRNACREPWQNNLDLRIGQVIPTVRGQNLQLTVDVLNFLNLLDSSWGRNKYVPFGTSELLSTSSTTPDENGKVVFKPFQEGYQTLSVWDLSSRYQIQLGLRYSF